MPDYRLQRFRGGWAIATYEGGERRARCRLEAGDEAAAQREFAAIVASLTRKPLATVRDLWDAYRVDRAGRVIAANMRWSGKPVLAHFGALDPETITMADCRAYTAKRRAADIADGTIWTELGHLRIVLVWARNAHHIDDAPAIERPSPPDPKDRYFTRDEVERLLAAAVLPHIRLFILLAIGTGARNAALLELTWDRVDFNRGLIDLRRPGTTRRKGRGTPPMNDGLRAALTEAAAGRRTDHVIEWAGRPVSKVRRALSTAADKACVAEVTPHVFRHSAAVWMAESDVDMRRIAEFLGHSDSRTTERVYARFRPSHLREAAAVLQVGTARSVRRF